MSPDFHYPVIPIYSFVMLRFFLQLPQYASKCQCATFEIPTAKLLKFHLFWDVMVCAPRNVAEVRNIVVPLTLGSGDKEDCLQKT